MTNSDPIKVQWRQTYDSFGEALGRMTIAYASGRAINWSPRDEAEVFGAGTVMLRAVRGFATPADHRPAIWGAGLAGPAQTKFKDNVDFHAVRGPITASLLGLENLPMGEPGLLIDRLAGESMERGDAVGIIPHEDTFETGCAKLASIDGLGEAKIIDPRTQDALSVAKQIQSCRHVFSETLYGLIMADAFNIPSTWVAEDRMPKLSFMDYFLGVQRPYTAPIGFDEIPAVEKATRRRKVVPYYSAVESCRETILAAFPDHLKAG